MLIKGLTCHHGNLTRVVDQAPIDGAAAGCRGVGVCIGDAEKAVAMENFLSATVTEAGRAVIRLKLKEIAGLERRLI